MAMKIDYEKLYNFLAENETMIKDILDTTKVFVSVATVYLVNNLGNRFADITNGMDVGIKAIQILSSTGGFIFIIYKIVEIHNRFKHDKKIQNGNKLFGRKKTP